jgi:hypothetical protein
MTLREIRSNCGSLRFQTPKARLQSSSGLFLDFSWVTGKPETETGPLGNFRLADFRVLGAFLRLSRGRGPRRGVFFSNRWIEKLAMTGADKEDDFVGEVVEFAKAFDEPESFRSNDDLLMRAEHQIEPQLPGLAAVG